MKNSPMKEAIKYAPKSPKKTLGKGKLKKFIVKTTKSK